MSPLRRRLTLALAFGLTLTAPAAAENKATPAERLKAIRKELADAEAAFRRAAEPLGDSAADEKKAEELLGALSRKQAEEFAAALELAQADPKSGVGFDALEWLLTTPRSYYLPPGKAAFELMAEHHAANPKVGKVIGVLAYVPPDDSVPTHQPALDLLRAVAERNADRPVRGQAALGLAWQAKRAFDAAEVRGLPNADALAAEAERQLESVRRDYGDCRNIRAMGSRPVTATLADELKTDLYELRNLRVGKPAPEIEGEDLNRAKFKLSDSRGKVTLLVFWASWCGPCMADVPHERELVEHFKGRPFVLVGVNADDKRDPARKAVDKAGITWRSFWNGEEGAGGPIALAWNVRGWPTVYVIDHKGVIRHKHLRRNGLDKPLEELVAAAEAAAKEGAR
jgi:thiol-disulfide isomerase/thioredoxin